MDYQPQQNMVTKFMRSKLRCAMEGKRAEFYQVGHWKIGIKRGQYIEYIIICTIIEKWLHINYLNHEKQFCSCVDEWQSRSHLWLQNRHYKIF